MRRQASTYGHPITFGVSVYPSTGELATTMRLASLADARRPRIGDADVWVERLTEWAIELGFDTFTFWPTTAPLSQVEAFANEVVPGVRARVSDRRMVALVP
jgi:hypothetical protein